MSSSLLPQRIQTHRLVLREPRGAEAADIFRSYAQDPLVCQFMVWGPHAAEAETQAFIASCIKAWDQGTRKPYVITEVGASAAIGMLEAWSDGFTVDCGYVLARMH